MIINEDYFDDLDIKDEDIVTDDVDDVEEPLQELTLDDVHKLLKQYNHNICFRIENKSRGSDTTFTQTTLLPRLFKRLDTIFEMYGIEHSLYVLTEYINMNLCDTVVKFGKYQLFCNKPDEDLYINNTYNFFQIQVYVNYPMFNNYKRAFRFLYTVLNLYRIDKQIGGMTFIPIIVNDYIIQLSNDYIIQLNFVAENNHIRFYYYNTKTREYGNEIIISKVLSKYHKIEFYNSVLRHFFGYKVNNIDYGAIDRDAPIKPLMLR